MTKTERHLNGAWGWLGLAIYVATYDALARETLSRAFYRSIEHPKRRWLTIVVWVMVTLHLFRFIPQRLDAIHWIGQGYLRLVPSKVWV